MTEIIAALIIACSNLNSNADIPKANCVQRVAKCGLEANSHGLDSFRRSLDCAKEFHL